MFAFSALEYALTYVFCMKIRVDTRFCAFLQDTLVLFIEYCGQISNFNLKYSYKNGLCLTFNTFILFLTFKLAQVVN